MGWNLENLWLEARDKVFRPALGAAVSLETGGMVSPNVFTQRKSGGQSYMAKPARKGRQLGMNTGHSGYVNSKVAEEQARYGNAMVEYPGYTPPIVPPDDTWLPNVKVNVPYMGEVEIKDALEFWDKLTKKAADAYYGNNNSNGSNKSQKGKMKDPDMKDPDVKLTRRGEYIPAAKRRRTKYGK